MRFHLPRLGHVLIDRQHARLAADTRALYLAVVRGRSARAPLGQLIRDTRRHFASEARLMRAVDYVEADGHDALHQQVLGDMMHCRRMLDQGLTLHPKHAIQLLDWLAHHATAADRNLVACLRRS